MLSKPYFVSTVLAPLAVGLVVMAAGIAVGQTPANSASAAADELPDAPGKETMSRVCSACHAPELVLQQSTDRAGWEDLVRSMVDRGAVASDAELKQIVEYLATNVATPSGAAASRAAGN